MVEAARKHDRIVQVGTHRRSSRLYMQLAEVDPLGGDRQGDRGPGRRTAATWPPAGIGHAPESEPPADLDWDLWLGPRPARPFQVDDHAVQVPLVAALFVAGGQLGRPLLRPDPLADRRAGPGVGLGPRRPVRRGRRPDHPRHHDRRSSSTPRGCSRSSASSRPTASPSWAEAPRSSCGGRWARSTPTIDGLRDRPRARRPVPGPQAQAQAGGRQGHRRRPRPAGGARLPRQRQEPQAAQSPTSRRATARPPSPTWPTSPWPPASGSTGTRRPSASPTATRPTRCSTTSTASRGPWALNAPARGTVSSAPT